MEAEVRLFCLRWNLRYQLSERDIEEMLIERGLAVESLNRVSPSCKDMLRKSTREFVLI